MQSIGFDPAGLLATTILNLLLGAIAGKLAHYVIEQRVHRLSTLPAPG